MSFLHEDVTMFRRPRTADGNHAPGRPNFGQNPTSQPSHKSTPSHPPPTSQRIWPERAKTWKRIDRMLENVDSDRATPSLPDQQPFLIYSDAFANYLGPNPALSLLITDPRALFFHSGGTFVPSLSTLFLSSALLKDNDPGAVSAANKRTEISKVDFYSQQDFTRDKVRCPERSYMTAGCCILYSPDGPGIVFAAQGTLKEPAGLVYVSSTRPHKTRMLIANFRGLPFNSPRDIASHPIDGTLYFTDPGYGYEQGFRPRPKLPTGHIYRFDPDTGDCRVMASGLHRPCGLCFSPDGSILYVSDADAGRNSGITIHAFDISHYPSSLWSYIANGPLSTSVGNISIHTPPSSATNSASSHHPNPSISTTSSSHKHGVNVSNTTSSNGFISHNATAQLSPPNSSRKNPPASTLSPTQSKMATRTTCAKTLASALSGSGSRSPRNPSSPILSPQTSAQLASARFHTATQSQPFLCNKRVFAFSPASGSGNIAADPSNGMIWQATPEGVDVWAPWGELVGKVSISEGSKGVTGIGFAKSEACGWDVFLMGGERLWGVRFG